MLFEDIWMIVNLILDFLPYFHLFLEGAEQMVSFVLVVPQFWVFVDNFGDFESVADFYL